MLMTEKKLPTRAWLTLAWITLVSGLVWLSSVPEALSQTPPDSIGPKRESIGLVEVPVFKPQQRSRADPLALYPDGLRFDVYRKGARVGRHTVEFKKDGDSLKVKSHLKLKVKVLFVTVYKYEFHSVGVWQDGEFQSVKAKINDNGKEQTVDGSVDASGRFFSKGYKGEFVSESWVYPTNHWNVGAVDSDVVLDTLNGKLSKVKILQQGIESIETRKNGVIEAERFEYTGELKNVLVWYDRDGRWVGMKFTTNKGETLTYVCRECGLSVAQGQILDAI